MLAYAWPHSSRTSNYSSICLSKSTERKGRRSLVCENCHSFLKCSVCPRFLWLGASYTPGSPRIRKAVSVPAAAAGLGTKPRWLQAQRVTRTIRGGEPGGGPGADCPHAGESGAGGSRRWAPGSDLRGLPPCRPCVSGWVAPTGRVCRKARRAARTGRIL